MEFEGIRNKRTEAESTDLGDDPDGDVEGYDGGFTPPAATGVAEGQAHQVEEWNAAAEGESPPEHSRSEVSIVSPDEYLRRTPQRNAYRAEMAGMAAEPRSRPPVAAASSDPARFMPELVDARRVLEKVEMTLRRVELYFEHKDQMNAAQHTSDRVITSPLHSQVSTTLAAIDQFHQGYTR